MSVVDPSLGEVLASQALLVRAWPLAASDVIMLLQLLRLSVPSLAETLAMGLVVLIPASGHLIEVRYGRAALIGVGRRNDESVVHAPLESPHEVTRLDVRDVRVANRSRLMAAA